MRPSSIFVMIVALSAAGCAHRLAACTPQMMASSEEVGDSRFGMLQCKAATGDKEAQLALGKLYEAGQGRSADARRAASFYRAAGSFDDGTAYIYSPAVGESRAQVIPIRRGPQQAGLPEAQYRLGLLYLEGRGVKRSIKNARTWLTRAADAGFALARERLRQLD